MQNFVNIFIRSGNVWQPSECYMLGQMDTDHVYAQYQLNTLTLELKPVGIMTSEIPDLTELDFDDTDTYYEYYDQQDVSLTGNAAIFPNGLTTPPPYIYIAYSGPEARVIPPGESIADGLTNDDTECVGFVETSTGRVSPDLSELNEDFVVAY